MTGHSSGRGAAFSHGFSRRQEALAGTRLMLDAIDQVSDAEIVRLIHDVRSPEHAPVARSACEQRSNTLTLYRPGKQLSPAAINHDDYVALLLSSTSQLEVLDIIAHHFLGRSVDEHARALDHLRLQYRRIHRLLIQGDGTLALDAIRRDNTMTTATRETLLEVVRIHMRCWLIRTARDRVDLLASHALQPRGTAFAGFTEWKTAGHVFLATQAAPAKLLQRIIAASRAGSFDGMTDEQTFDRLTELGLISSDERDPLLLKLKGITYRLGRSAAFAWPSSFRSVHEKMAAASVALSRVTQRDMQEAGFSRMDLNGYRHGLATSEITTWVALELHRAGRHLDACIEARLTGAPLPEHVVEGSSIKQLAYSSTILRADAGADRHAVNLDRNDSNRNTLDQARNSGAVPVRKMLSKLGNPALAAHLRAELAIDVTAWFCS